MWPGQWVAVSAMGSSKVKPFDDGHGGVSTSVPRLLIVVRLLNRLYLVRLRTGSGRSV